MVKWHKKASMLIVVLLLLSSITPVFAQTADYFNSWAKEEIGKWLSIGVIKTDETGQFKPTEPITRLDIAILLNNIFQYKEKAENKFSDVADNMPFADDVAKAVAAGNFKGYDGKFRPNDPISRQEASLVFSRAFGIPVSDKNNLDKFIDSKNVESWSKDAVNAIVGCGYMQGKPGNLFAPAEAIERCEAVRMVDNIIEDLKNRAGTYTGTVKGNLVVNTSDVVLKDMSIEGDLYLTEGIGDGEVKLENVTVAGRTIVTGGGENSIVLNNTSISGSLIIIKKDGKIRVVATGSSEVNNIALSSGARLVENNLTGKGFGEVEVIRIEPGQQILTRKLLVI